MSDPVILCELVLSAAFIAYSLFGGADFGGGIWTALAFGPRRQEQRDALFDSIGPVWETNHVWLIFIVVTLFTAFPYGFSILFTVLLTPLVLALVGINFRGAAFAFRHFGRQSRRELPLTAAVFEVASILTPFSLGLAVSALAAGGFRLLDGHPVMAPAAWLNPFTLMGGVIGMAICAYLAPVYMTVRVGGALRDDFRKMSIMAGVALGVLTALTVPLAAKYSPLFAHRLLTSWPTVLVLFAVAAGAATQLFLWRRLFPAAQIGAAATVTFTLGGFAAALSPDLIIGELPVAAAAAPRPTLVAFLAVLPVGAAILIPSLIYLYWTFRGTPDSELPPAGTQR